MWVVIYLFVFIFAFRLLTNIFRLFATKYYYHAYKQKSKRIMEYSKPIGKLFDKADTQRMAIDETHGHIGMIYKERISNMLSKQRMHIEISEAFEKTIGVYKYRIRENFYPLFWLSIPVYVLNQVNVRPNRVISILINILFWLVSAVGVYLLEKFLDTTPLGQDFVLTLNNILK